MKDHISIYLTFAFVAIGLAALLIASWRNLFRPEHPKSEKAARLWSSYLFLAGICLLVFGLFVYFVIERYSHSVAVIHGLGVGLILAVIMVGSFDMGRVLTSQSAFFGSVSLFVVVLVVVLLVAVNYIGIRRSQKYDFNLNKLESLTDQSVKVLKDLRIRVDVVGFLYEEEKNQEAQVRDFLDRYRSYNVDQFHYKVVNPLNDPQVAECYGVKESGSDQLRNRIILSIGRCETRNGRTAFKGKKVAIQNLTEQDFTNQLIKLTRSKEKEICFLTGRGQPKLDAQEDRFSFHQFGLLLTDKGFKTRALDLVTEKEVPASCNVLINAAPEAVVLLQQQIGVEGARLSEAEVDMIKAYLQKGGKLLAFQEPRVRTGIEPLLKLYGIESHPEVVIDFAANVRQNPMMPFAPQYDGAHEITKGFLGQARTFFLWASPVEISKARPPNVALSSLITSARVVFQGVQGTSPCCAFAIPDPTDESFARLLQISRAWRRNVMLYNVAQGIVQKTVKGARPGPFGLAAAASKKVGSKETRIVVFGDSAIASNMLLGMNRSLLLNSVAWLAQERDLVHIPTKQRKPSRIFLSSTQKNLLRYSTRFGMPVFFLFIILFVMVSRRHK